MKKYLFMAAAALILAACSNDDKLVDEPVEAQICATIGESTVSRANDETWAPGDVIGITMHGLYNNVKYTTEADDGKFSGTTMYFKNKTDKVNITAYYPFTGTEGTASALIETNTEASRQSADEQVKIDFLFAALNDVSGASPVVDLVFSHKMSKLTFVFKNGNDGTDVGKIISYKIDGLVLDGTFNPADGVCEAKSESEPRSLIMDMPLGTVQNDKSVDPLILFPQNVNKLAMKIYDSENQVYSCVLNLGEGGLVAGNNYLFTITVKKTSLTVNSSVITNWKTESGTSDAKSDDSDDSYDSDETDESND